jgi:hypothetical protein
MSVHTETSFCEAFLKRNGQYCGRLNEMGASKCRGHGGLSTGPRTSEGKARIAAAKTIHGRETRALRQLRSQICHDLRRVEDAMFAEGLIHGPRTRGRKPTLWAQSKPMSSFHTTVSAP